MIVDALRGVAALGVLAVSWTLCYLVQFYLFGVAAYWSRIWCSGPGAARAHDAASTGSC